MLLSEGAICCLRQQQPPVLDKQERSCTGGQVGLLILVHVRKRPEARTMSSGERATCTSVTPRAKYLMLVLTISEGHKHATGGFESFGGLTMVKLLILLTV